MHPAAAPTPGIQCAPFPLSPAHPAPQLCVPSQPVDVVEGVAMAAVNRLHAAAQWVPAGAGECGVPGLTYIFPVDLALYGDSVALLCAPVPVGAGGGVVVVQQGGALSGATVAPRVAVPVCVVGLVHVPEAPWVAPVGTVYVR